MAQRIDLDKVRSLLQKPTAASKEELKNDVAPEFELDDDGEEYIPVGTKGLLAASQKLLAINRGLTEPDERDSMKFQKVYRINSMVREGIKMDAGKVAKAAMFRAAKRRDLKGMEPGIFNAYVDRVTTGNPLTSPLEEINPMHLVENARRISRMGPGGLRSSESITEEAQSVHPSQFGFISTVEGPECCTDNQWIAVKGGWKKISEVTVDDEICTKVGEQIVFEKPIKVIHEPYEGYVLNIKNEYVDIEVTPNHRMIVRPEEETEWRLMPAEVVYGASVHVPSDSMVPTYIDATHWTRKMYKGYVHCVNIPHHVICLSFDKDHCIWTGNSERAGIDVRVAWGAKLGSDGRLYQKFYDRHSKRYKWLSAADLDGLTVKLPD